MTKILDLPSDLEEEIISRLPLKSLRAVRLTCTKWNALLKSQRFIMMHIGKAAGTARKGESKMIVLMDYNLYLLSVFIDDVDHPSTEVKGKLTCLEEQVKVNQVFHCEGLLLCILIDDPRVVVWNPNCGPTRWIEPRYAYRETNGELGPYIYAIGYVKNKKKESRRSHKILRFLYFVQPDFSWYEIYDFDTDSWRTLDVTPDWKIVGNGVSFKGNTYWCARESGWWNSHIICFDFTRERFGPLLPLPFRYEYGSVGLSCVRNGKLAVLYHDMIAHDDVEIWITTKIEAEKVSWSKFLTLDLRQVISIRTLLNFRGYYIDEEKKVAVVFYQEILTSSESCKLIIIGDYEYARQLDLGEYTENCRPQACSYVPSLAQIKQPEGANGNQESSLEKRLYGQKMLRVVEFDKRTNVRLEETILRDRI